MSANFDSFQLDQDDMPKSFARCLEKMETKKLKPIKPTTSNRRSNSATLSDAYRAAKGVAPGRKAFQQKLSKARRPAPPTKGEEIEKDLLLRGRVKFGDVAQQPPAELNLSSFGKKLKH